MTGPNRPTRAGMRWGSARLRVPLLVVLCWLASVTPALATILDEPESLTEGSDAVVRVHFDVRIQYQRHAPTGSADLVEVFFQIIGTNLTLAPGVEEVVFPGLAGVAPPVSGAAGAVEKDRYAITLQTVPLDKQNDLRPVPGRFQDYTVFTTRGWRGGTAVVELNLGYFDTKAEADKIRQSALREFPEATVFDVIERKEQNLAKAAEGAPARPAPPAPPAPAPPPIVPGPTLEPVAPITEAA